MPLLFGVLLSAGSVWVSAAGLDGGAAGAQASAAGLPPEAPSAGASASPSSPATPASPSSPAVAALPPEAPVAVAPAAAAAPPPVEAALSALASSSPSALAPTASLYSLLGSMALYDPAATADPWSVLPRTSGLSMTRAYVAGYGGRPGEAFVGAGAAGDQGVFRIEGFEVGDAASPGVPLNAGTVTAQEVQVTAGGGDLTALSPGLQINLVERRGTNEWRASARGLGTAGSLAAAASRVQGLAPGQAASERVSGDRVRDASALGAEAGGPLLQDTLWAWGGVDRSRTALSAFGGQPLSSTDLVGAAKLDARPLAANSATLSWNRGSRAGSGEGAGPDRSPETNLDRRAHDEVWRLADTEVFSASMYADASAGMVAAGAQDTPRGGLQVPLLIDAAGVAHGSWYADDNRRTSRAAFGELSDSRQFAGATHELKLAGEWRQTREEDHWQAPAWAQITAGPVLGLPAGENGLDTWRDGDARDQLTRQGLWAADTLSWSRATASFGLRYDRQTPRNLSSTTPGVPGDPFLRQVDFAGNDAGGLRWSSLAPRLSLAYAPSGVRRLLLRASLARYAAQLSSAIAARVDPAAPASAGYYVPAGFGPYGKQDGARFWYPNGFDPTLPPNVPANQLDSRLRPELTDEAILGAEYALPADGAVGLLLVYRRVSGVLEDRLLVRDGATQAVRVATVADWVPAGVAAGTLPDGAAFSMPYYDLRPGLAPTGGTLLTNGDRQQQRLGATIEWHQRLARRWTTRGHFTWQSWTWKLGPRYRHFADPSYLLIDGAYNGQPVAGQSPLPGGRPLYLSSPWTFDLSSVVQLPAALSAAVEISGRQGLPLAYYRTVARNLAGPVDLRLTDNVDSFRSDDLVSLGARLDKDFNLNADIGVTLSLEALNVLATGQVLRRETNLGVGRANFVDEVVAPRLLRLGLRLQFR